MYYFENTITLSVVWRVVNIFVHAREIHVNRSHSHSHHRALECFVRGFVYLPYLSYRSEKQGLIKIICTMPISLRLIMVIKIMVNLYAKRKLCTVYSTYYFNRTIIFRTIQTTNFLYTDRKYFNFINVFCCVSS